MTFVVYDMRASSLLVAGEDGRETEDYKDNTPPLGLANVVNMFSVLALSSPLCSTVRKSLNSNIVEIVVCCKSGVSDVFKVAASHTTTLTDQRHAKAAKVVDTW